VHPRPALSLIVIGKKRQRLLCRPESRRESSRGTISWIDDFSELSAGLVEAGHDQRLDALVRPASSDAGQPIVFEELLSAAQVGGCGFGVSAVLQVRVDGVAAARSSLLCDRCRVGDGTLGIAVAGGSCHLLGGRHELIDNWVGVRHGS